MHKLTGPLLLLGSGADAASIRYATGFSAPDAVVYLRWKRRQWLVVPVLEISRARAATSGVTVLSPLDLALSKTARRDVGAWMLALLARLRCRRVCVTPSFPVGTARRLERRGLRLRVLAGAVFPEREIKSSREIEKISAVQRAAVAALRRAIRCLRAARIAPDRRLLWHGRVLTSEALQLEIGMELLRQGCQPGDIIAACGEQAVNPHACGAGPLQAGQPIVMDIFPRHATTGYWGDLTRTVVKGRAAPALRRAHQAVDAAQKAALGRVKAGVAVATVHRAAEAVFRRRGYATDLRGPVPRGFIHGTGHGVGLEIHEAPTLAAVPGRLKAGQIVTVEPGLYYPGLGGIRREDTILVTRRGWRYLAPCQVPREV
ncbi:MAG: M24 family metallopeptidase [Kiritimatiellaeota bacterium]|nr:M24 family metallopeptidase [Kiritimatiellota bacterium]